ncbi:serine-rich adhesin for platelets [Aplysia californica]|uniref:Serine-rich adhesin for platelets n=1 Tax=Aplysia californica TaxID=6500 RepID=A0ABM0JSS8_APLCA|nr:serine-rich adhesin for platelets [Aplysia californica]
MDPFGISEFDDLSSTPTDTTTTTKSALDEFDVIFGTGSVPSGGGGAAGSSASSEPPKLSETKGHNLLFSLDEGDSSTTSGAFPASSSSSADTAATAVDLFSGLDEARRAEDSVTTRDLFDDLLDFTPSSGPGTQAFGDGQGTNGFSATEVDLLSGLGNSTSDSVDVPPPQVTKGPPDLLDFFDDVSADLPEVSSFTTPSDNQTDETDGPVSVVKSSPEVSAETESFPDILVSTPSVDVNDGVMEGKTVEVSEEEKMDGKGEKEMVDGKENREIVQMETQAPYNPDQDMLDFSVVAIPDSSQLNFDLSKHKRLLSKKGSIARRKKPSRAAILAGNENSEENRFNDSTEPRPAKPPAEDKEEEKTAVVEPEPEPNKPEEAEPVIKKFAGGVKIPGLLEGLTKSRSFKRAERKHSPERNESSVPGFPAQAAMKPPSPVVPVTADNSVSGLASSCGSAPAPAPALAPTPAVRPKPVALPRVLPKTLPSKLLKDSKNVSTAKESTENTEANVALETDKKTVEVKNSSSLFQEMRSRKMEDSASVSAAPPSPDSKVAPPAVGAAAPKLARRGGPPPPLKPKPDGRVPPTIPSKPVLPSKPKRASLLGSPAVDSPPKETSQASEFPTKKPLPPLSKPNPPPPSSSSSSSSADAPVSRRDLLRTTGSFRVDLSKSNSEIPPKKELKPTGSFRSTLGKTSDTPTSSSSSYLARLKSESENRKKSDAEKANGEESKEKSENLKSGNSGISGSSLSSIDASDKSSEREKNDAMKDVEQTTKLRRKSSVSHVESPLEKDRSSSISSRKSSISGSAYAPIGFRSPLSGSDNESKSRGSSVSSSDATPFGTSATRVELRSRDNSFNSFEGQRSRDNSVNSTAHIELAGSTVSSSTTDSSVKQSPLSVEKSPQLTVISKEEENKKEKADDTNKQLRSSSISNTPTTGPTSITPTKTKLTSSANGRSNQNEAADKKPMFGVQLRKVDKKTPQGNNSPSQPKEEDESPVKWRQQLSNKRRSFVPDKEPEKPKSDSTPEWARASIARRKRLMDAGVIKSDR